jgi:hypothetical protein
VPILVRHQTVAPYAQAASNAGNFAAQRDVNDEQFRYAQFSQANIDRDEAMAMESDQFNRRLEAAAREEEAERLFRESAMQFDAGERRAADERQNAYRVGDREDEQQFRGTQAERDRATQADRDSKERGFRTTENARDRAAQDRRNQQDNFTRIAGDQARAKAQQAAAQARGNAAAQRQQYVAQEKYLSGLVDQAKLKYDTAYQQGNIQDMNSARDEYLQAEAQLNGFRGSAAGMNFNASPNVEAAPDEDKPLPIGVAAPPQLPTSPVPASINSPEQISALPPAEQQALAKRRAMQLIQTLPPNYTPAQKKQQIANMLRDMGFDLNAIGAL